MSGPEPLAIAVGSFWAIKSQGWLVMSTLMLGWVALNLLTSATYVAWSPPVKPDQYVRVTLPLCDPVLAVVAEAPQPVMAAAAHSAAQVTIHLVLIIPVFLPHAVC